MTIIAADRWLVARPLLAVVLVACLSGCPGAAASYDAVAPLEARADRSIVDTLIGPDGLLTPDGASDGARDIDWPDTAPAAPCAAQADPITIALYTFEGSGNVVADVVGQNPGQTHGSGVTRVPGKTGCGNALYVPEVDDHYLEIPNSPSWLLTKGAVDLWVRFDEFSEVQNSRGIISRDASGTEFPNHLSIYLGCDNAIILRYQLTNDNHHYQCSTPVANDTWHHVGVNFGPPGLQLFVDGKPATRTDAVMGYSDGKCVASTTNLCGRTSDQGIDGNNNPWVVGASAMTSEEGKATPVTNPLGGSIDSLRISSTHRSF